MKVGRRSCLSMVATLVLLLNACTQEGSGTADKRPVEEQGAKMIDSGLVRVIKNGKLAGFSSTTIGDALDSYRYLKDKEWRTEHQQSGHFTVDFIGQLERRSYGVGTGGVPIADRNLEVKFVINPDGSYYLFMISVIDRTSDGRVQRTQLTDTGAVLRNIYDNKKITM